ncbi:MAG: general secretion pathway protein GspK, partial [Planctomycetaceae bacterium]|nr:general secretion pathway protein GspK [Planctomycetaceae bacterium]
MALILVLVVCALMALAAYQFADSMIVYATHVRTDHRYAIEQSLAESAGATILAAIEARDVHDVSSTFGVKHLIAGHRLLETRDGSLLGKFSVYFETENASAREFVMGLEDESAKLNLHSLPLSKEQQHRARTALMQVPGLTAQIADSILDWIDADDEPRPFGAETSYYSSLPQPYRAANGRLESLDDLLLVRGVTKQLLHGETASSEVATQTARTSVRAWDHYLTVVSRECNTARHGTARININDHQLDRIYDQIAGQHSAELAKFVVALRLAGPMDGGNSSSQAMSEEDEIAQAELRIKQQLMDPPASANEDKPKQAATRDGMDLSARPVYRIRSLADLWGTKVRLLIDGKDEVLTSPWREDPRDLRKLYADVGNTLSTHAETTIEGRVNVNRAPQEVLQMIPGLGLPLAQAIALRQRDLSGELLADRLASRNSLAWLVEDGLVSAVQLRELAPYLTCRGDVYRGLIGCQTAHRNDIAKFAILVDGASPRKSLRYIKYLGRENDATILKALSLESAR